MPNSATRRLPHPPAGARLVRMPLAVALVALTSVGCATTDEVRYGSVVAAPGAYDASNYAVPQPLSLGEIVAALRAGRSSHDLADDIDENGLLAPATSADIDLLLQSGADAELIDAVREASSMAGQGAASPPMTIAPPVTVSPPVIVTPPPVYPNYGWYPYAPYVPFSFGLWYNDVPRYRAPRYRPEYRGPDRWRPGDRERGPRPSPSQGWQSPRVSPTPSPSPGAGNSIRPGGSPPASRGLFPPATRTPPAGSPRVSPGSPQGSPSGSIRDRRTVD